MRSLGTRKGQTNITHLMNFSLPPRPQSYQHGTYGRTSRRNPTWGLGSGYHAIDKARFVVSFFYGSSDSFRYVHANYRFIVNPKGEYRSQAVDADVHLDWTLILQILASAQTQCSSCPICLSTPVAPRMAKCGHIFCLPCLLRYMHSSDETKPTLERKPRWKKCPICWDSIYSSETRPVRWFNGQEGIPPREGDDVVLRLVMRQPGSTLALPRDGADTFERSEDIPWFFAVEVMDYARVMKGSEDYMIAQYDLEIEAVQRQEREDELMFGEDAEWTKKAVNSINDAKVILRGIGNPPSIPQQPTEKKPKKPTIRFNNSNEDVPDMYFVQHASKTGQSSGGSNATDASSVSSQAGLEKPLETANRGAQPSQSTLLAASSFPSSRQANHPHQSDSPYYFYQALLHYYLSPLDIRILKSAFGEFASFPSTILPRVERVSTGHTVDDDLRKRAKYLAHLPYGCEVGFLECDWTDIVAPEVLDHFKSEIDHRKKRNKDKETREEKERLRAEKEEDDKRWAAARRKRPTPRSDVAEAQMRSLSEVHESSIHTPREMSVGSASPPWPSRARHQNGSAFASLASPSSSPVAPRTVWGTTLIAPSSPPSAAEVKDHDASDNDGWLQGWERDLLHQDDELVAQMQATSLLEGASSGGNANPSTSKKKKAKKITLMTTNARRGA
jgi:hypothetical protein